MVFSDEPYCHMVWEGRHTSILAEPGMLEHTVAAYTFSKSYSMSGWRIGFAVAHPDRGGGDRQADQHHRLVLPLRWPSGRPRPPSNMTPPRGTITWAGSDRKVERLCAGLQECRRFQGRAPGRDVLRLSRRASRLQSPGNHLARPGALPARGGRRRIRRRLPGRRMLRRCRPWLPSLQLRRARRADRSGHRLHSQSPEPKRPRAPVSPGESSFPVESALPGALERPDPQRRPRPAIWLRFVKFASRRCRAPLMSCQGRGPATSSATHREIGFDRRVANEANSTSEAVPL